MSGKVTGISATFALVIGAGLALWLLSSPNGQAESGGWESPPTPVALAKVQQVNAPRALHAVGELEAVRQVQLAAEVAGRINRINFVSGETVKAGQLLVQLNDAPEQAERERLIAQLRNAEQTLSRTQALQESRAMTREQLDNAIAARDMAKGELQRIEAIIAQKAIRAPFAGVMGIARVHLGQYLNPGETIANLVDASGLRVNFSLPEQALAQLAIGQAVEVAVDAWPDEPFKGEISAIDPLVTSARTVWAQAAIVNTQGRLQAGMFANVQVLMPDDAPVLAVPETAITYASYGQTVFVAQVDDNKVLRVHRATVQTGQRWKGAQQSLVEILSGLDEGQQVVTSGQIKLSDGMAVAPSAPQGGTQ